MKKTLDNKWFKSRGYAHFDNPVRFTWIEPRVKNPDWVAKHAFWPLIGYENVTEKFKRDASGLLVSQPKERSIAYASHVDSHIYSYYSWVLSQHYERRIKVEGFSSSVLAFRSLGKSNIDFAAQAFDDIKRMGECHVIGMDVSKFFDSLSHKILKKMWASLIDAEGLPEDHYAVYRAITKFSTVDRTALIQELELSKNRNYKANERYVSAEAFRNAIRAKGLVKANRIPVGIPQGSPISAILSNVYMLDFDKAVHELISEVGGVYYRYCDDILVIVKPEFGPGVFDELKRLLNDKGLTANEKKTEYRQFYMRNGKLSSDKPVQYLGFTYDGVRVLIRSAAFARYSNRMKRGINLARKTAIKVNKLRQSNGVPTKKIYRHGLYEKYSHLGKRNFITYGHRCVDKFQSNSIRKQLKPWWERLIEEIEKADRLQIKIVKNSE